MVNFSRVQIFFCPIFSLQRLWGYLGVDDLFLRELNSYGIVTFMKIKRLSPSRYCLKLGENIDASLIGIKEKVSLLGLCSVEGIICRAV